MRRVRGHQGSSELSGSARSQQSQSIGQKSKRKIEIEKASDNDGNDYNGEESYLDDEFEDISASQTNEKQRLQQQLLA